MSKQEVLFAGHITDSPTCCGVQELGGLNVISKKDVKEWMTWDEDESAILNTSRDATFGELTYTIKKMTKVNKKLEMLGFKKLHSFKSNTTGNQVYIWFRNPKRRRKYA